MYCNKKTLVSIIDKLLLKLNLSGNNIKHRPFVLVLYVWSANSTILFEYTLCSGWNLLIIIIINLYFRRFLI